ncbi:MAG TPA: chemotaxis protein CheA [Stellaceae bacterium]|jgi:two-component system chemotaxis sensor kinase CheA|nr:chemotaxis protein CheA [Stellaceae bacterium]
MSTPDFAETFRQEAQDLLEQLEQALLDLEQAPDDHTLVDSAFRSLHTIKGSGAMFGFPDVAEFTHEFETAFDRVRKGDAPSSRKLIAIALAAKDHIRLLIDRPQDADPAVARAILDDLVRTVGSTHRAESATPPAAETERRESAAPDGDAAIWHLRLRFAEDVLIRGTNPLGLLDELRALGSCVVTALTADVPALEDMQADSCHLEWDVVLTTAHPKAAIEEVFLFVADDMELTIEPLASPDVPALPPTASESDALPGASEAGEGRSRKPDAESGHGAAKMNTSLRVQAERLDELMDRVGELVIAQARLTQLATSSTDANIKSVAEEIERLASGLRDTTMGIRMVPIGSLFGRFRRLIHDLSRDLGKQVELATIGEETELDKTMIERLADPLVHLIRNAIDHGLEDPQSRKAAGKQDSGRIRLIARHSGAEVLVTVSDDGRGLDRNRIRAKAEEQGLLAPGTAITDAELYQFLFHPGFSTAKEISAVSGRGVGMDVVKRTIESMRGGIDISTTPGRGTEITLRLPLTLAIIEGLLVRVGNGRYALPLSAVEECVELSHDDDTRSQGRSFLNIRGDLVPFLRLREIFETETEADPYQKVVIVSSSDLRVGLVVDQIIGSHQTVIKSLSKLHADAETFSGATILGDGTVALILDIAHLVELGQAREEKLKARQSELT